MHNILFHNNKFIIRLYMFRALCAHHQEVKIALYSIFSQTVHGTGTYRFDDTRCCIIQFSPPDDEHIVLETCRRI